MHKFLAFLLFSSIAVAQQPATWRTTLPTAWGSLTDGWQLALYSEKQSYKVNEPVWIKIAARNASAVSLKVGYYTSPWMAANFAVQRTSDGTAVQLRPARNEIDKVMRRAGSVLLKVVQPGQVLYLREIDLRTLFELAAGTYTVTASTRLTSPQAPQPKTPDKLVSVSSDQITVTVVGQ